MTIRFCKICKDWHSLSEDWPVACYGHFGPKSAASPQIISDIQPYQAVAVDVATGKPPKIGSRSEHREFLKRNNYIELGNDRIKPKPVDYGDISPREIKQTIDQLRSQR